MGEGAFSVTVTRQVVGGDGSDDKCVISSALPWGFPGILKFFVMPEIGSNSLFQYSNVFL